MNELNGNTDRKITEWVNTHWKVGLLIFLAGAAWAKATLDMGNIKDDLKNTHESVTTIANGRDTEIEQRATIANELKNIKERLDKMDAKLDAQTQSSKQPTKK